MSSIKEKLKSKIKSRLEQPDTMESFDENAVAVSLSQGKGQLAEIRLQCVWNIKSSMKVPRLRCRWYNRTQDNLQEIVGVEDEVYQPSILDVGSIIEVSCVPELPGVSYEGMPIQLKSAPISLAPETEKEATHFVEQARGKFFIELKEARIKGRNIAHGCESLLKVEGCRLVLSQMKFGQLNDDVLKDSPIDELYPQLVLNRRLSRELLLRFSQDEHCTINFKNHEMRDVFCLLHKLILARLTTKKEEPEPATVLPERPPKVEAQNPIVSLEKQERKSSEEAPVPKEAAKMETESPRKEAAKPAEVPKQSAVDLLQLSNLKQEIKQLEVANAKLLKELELEKEKNYSLENKISETGERLQSASRNYFALETELTQAREEASSLRQEMQQKNNISNGRDEELLYYKNEIKVLSAEKLRLSEAATDLASRHQSVLDELQNYRRLFNSGSELRPFHELEEELRSMKEMNKELKLRYQYSVEEKDRIEEDLRNSRTMVEEMEAEKKYIERKYESLTNELNSPSLALSKVSEKSNGDSHLSSSYVFEEMPCLDRKDSNLSAVSSVFGGEVDRHEKELQEVKRQAKELGEENNYLRGLLQKEKKSSSKSQLKLQLFEVKKLVGKLSEAMMEKDLCIANLREINRELNRKNTHLEHSQLKNSV